jgi:hypothetical protein
MYAEQTAPEVPEVLHVQPEVLPEVQSAPTSAPTHQQIVDSIRVCAEAALARGFKIIACLPHKKDAKYSPHACNSGTNDPKIALRPWLNGEEANYGVSCGLSGLTVVDCDHGIHSVEEFELWKKTHNLPDTYTVLSGRDGEELGFHLYYTGVIPTTGFSFGGVSGELKSAGGYVVGAGSIHPSGKRYVEYSDIDLVPLPEGLKLLAKNKVPVEFKPTAEGGTLIPAGQRWIHMQSAAGKFRNAGLDYDGIYAALKNFLKNNCEDGENYPEDKVQTMAKDAIKKFDAIPLNPPTLVIGPPKVASKPEQKAKVQIDPTPTPTPTDQPQPEPTPEPTKIIPSGHYSMPAEDWAVYDFSKEESEPLIGTPANAHIPRT